MKRLLLLAFVVAAFTSCITTYRDVDFQNSPTIFRGTWSGTLKNQCVNQISNPSWNSTGTRVAGFVNSSIRIWDIANGTVLNTIPTSSTNPPLFAINPEGTELLVGLGFQLERYAVGGGLISIVNTSQPVDSFSSNLERAVGISLIGNGTPALTVWNTRSGQAIWLLPKSNNSDFYTGRLSDDGTKVAVVIETTASKMLKVFDVSTKTLVFETVEPINIRWYLQGVAFRDNDFLIQLAEYSRSDSKLLKAGISRWNLTNGVLQRYIPTSNNPVRFLAGGRYAWASDDNGLRVLDMDLGTSLTYISTKVWRSLAPDLSHALVAVTDLCGEQVFDFSTESLTQKIVIDENETLATTINFVATYESASNYTVSGTAQIGVETFTLSGRVFGNCTVTGRFSTECDRYIRPAFSAIPIPFINFLKNGQGIGGMPLIMRSDVAGRFIPSGARLNGKTYDGILRPTP